MSENVAHLSRDDGTTEIKFEGAWFVVILTTFLGLYIVGISAWFLWHASTITKADKELFEAVVVNALLPLFTSLISAVLAWVFGKRLVKALVGRLAGRRDAQVPVVERRP